MPSTNNQGLINNALPNQDILINKCKDSFNECKRISEAKYDVSIQIIQVEKFDNITQATEFFNTWGGSGLFNFITLEYMVLGPFSKEKIEDHMPLVLLAYRIIGPEGQLPGVVVCGNDTKLTSYSKQSLLCGQ